ncbi:Trafficking protein particle complex II-specific subunit 1 [Ananas comosus]|uniref:Trafficking protein particle complex II-specific subunit 1 n=1 Tax=Ananas comosus TaxID=4615 RepID=A0A199UXP9_ANACO|nr:Trafficking protein particle complex II-specific subunit 1 [Ananas comosus]
MEPDVSMETMSTIRIAVVAVGGPIPAGRLREYAAAVGRHARVELSALASFYSEQQKSPFAHQPWDSGALRLRFVLGGSPPSPWEDFQSHRKILAVLALCHCPASPDLDIVAHHFAAACRPYPHALARRCFAFFPSDAQLREEKRDDIVLFPPSDVQKMEFHMLTMVQDLAASLLMEFEKCVLRTESAGTILKTPLDSQSSLGSEEVIKAKKRRLGRAQKTIGDYCLLAGSPVDANAHYSTAIELARLTGDVFWHAGALEGSVCALLVDRTGGRDPILEEEVKYRYYTVIQLYRRAFIQDNAQRVSTVSFELEAALKLARYLCRTELAKEVVELLMGAADGAKSLVDANDRLILYVEIARLFGTLGYQRKAAFFSRQVAQLYLQQDSASAAISAMQVLTMTTNAYHVQSRRTNPKLHAPAQELGTSHGDGKKMQPQSVVSLFESQWSSLQMVLLREILVSSVRAGDPLSAWSVAARLLRSFYPLITPAGQSGLASSLANSADRLPRNPLKKEWWTGSAPSGPFIYTPFSKGGTTDNSKEEITWVVGEPVQVLVELANPCSFDLVVESIYLSVHSGNFDAFPVSVNLPPNTAKVILLSGIPTKVGPISIPGCIVHCFGVITEHLFRDVDNLLLGAAQGLVLSDPFRCCGSGKLKNVSFPNISVVPPLPLLVSHVVGGNGSTILYEGEIRDIRICLTNAGTVPVEQAHITLSGKNQDSVISMAHDKLTSALPLKPGGEVTFTVTLKAWQLSLADSEVDASRNSSSSARRISKEGSSPLLAIYYAGPSTNSDESENKEASVPPGRRLVLPLNVCVLQGLRFVKARLLSMEIPAHVSDSFPKPTNINQSSTEEDDDVQDKDGSLVKIDPYKGCWGIRLLELELSNPTDVVFEVNVSVQLDNPTDEHTPVRDCESADIRYRKTRIDREYSARVLIPLENFKLPVLDGSVFLKDSQTDDSAGNKAFSVTERNAKAELNASINNLISKIKVQWQSGRNSSGELNIKEATQAALQASVMDILLPDPLTFGFRIANTSVEIGELGDQSSKNPIAAHEMTRMEVLIRNNTKETIEMSLNVTCKDVAGENCFEGNSATVLWAGVLGDINLKVPPLEEVAHSFSLYFLVPGDYTLQAAAGITNATDVLRARARADSAEEPIFCRGSPFHVRVTGTA